MGQIPLSMRQRIAKSNATMGGNKILHGIYDELIICGIRHELSPSKKDNLIIFNFRVGKSKKNIVQEVSATNACPPRTVDQEPNAVGSDCDDVINFDGAGKQSAEGNVKSILLGLYGKRNEEMDEDVAMATLGDLSADNQPARGMVIALTTYPKEKRTKPGEFITGLTWRCVDPPGQGENAPDKVAARRAILDKGAKAPAVTSTTAAAPPVPGQVPAAPTAPPAPVATIPVFPPAGWEWHPGNPQRTDGLKFLYKVGTSQCVEEKELHANPNQ